VPSFLNAGLIKGAVERLGTSRATVRMVDFLIFRRTLVLLSGDADLDDKTSIALSTRNQHYMQAIRDLMEWPVREMEPAERLLPYFNPFGTADHEDRGYRSPKYPSNGPSVTARGSAFSKITTLSGTNPSILSFKPGYQTLLPSILLKAAGDLPNFADAAIWFHRSRDVSAHSEKPASEFLTALMVETKNALSLEQSVVASLFDSNVTVVTANAQ
jgi:hypothetical protein